jgi:hypothetical protein
MVFRTGVTFIATIPALGAMLAIGSPMIPRGAAATGAVAPFCIATGGGGEGGGYRTSRCEFFDYQACIRAAIGGGNCVGNVDYRGEFPPPARNRH